jgi:hypothetical protein
MPNLPYLKIIPPLILGYIYFTKSKCYFRDIFASRSIIGFILTSLAFFFITFHPNKWAVFVAMALFILGRIMFFLNMRKIVGVLIIKDWIAFISMILPGIKILHCFRLLFGA